MEKMAKYAMPSLSFPYRITNRLALMALPRRQYKEDEKLIPKFSPTGVRLSALKGKLRGRTNECAWPYVGRLIMLKQMYRERFTRSRLEKIDRMITLAGGTIYTKLAKINFVLRKSQTKEDMKAVPRRKRGWNETDWKKHMDYISHISLPRPVFVPEPVERGPTKPLSELMERLEKLCRVAPLKMFKRVSQDEWYKDPVKVKPLALKYVITERVKKLAEPKKLPEGD